MRLPLLCGGSRALETRLGFRAGAGNLHCPKGGSWGWWPDSSGVSSMAASEVVGCHQTSNGGHHVGEIGGEGEIRVNHDLLPCYITLNESIF
jgi:hypothetical protein